MLKMSSDRSGAKCHAKALFNNNRQIVLLFKKKYVNGEFDHKHYNRVDPETVRSLLS